LSQADREKEGRKREDGGNKDVKILLSHTQGEGGEEGKKTHGVTRREKLVVCPKERKSI